MVGLKKRLETAEGELESLKRKRAYSNSPERAITAILKRPALHSPSGQHASRKDAPSSSAQPTPKKSRNRRSKWDEGHPSVPPKMPPTSSNRDGFKEINETYPVRKRDPVLHSTLGSARKKQDVIRDIKESAMALGLSHSDASFVFCRSNLQDQIEVTKKALSYVEIIVTST